MIYIYNVMIYNRTLYTLDTCNIAFLMIRTFIYVFEFTELSLTLLNLELSRIHNFFLNTCYKRVTVLILSILF